MNPISGADLRAVRPGLFVSSFLALLTALFVFSHSSTDILRFPDRAIGVGVLNGVDASRRYVIYLLLVSLPLGVWLGFSQVSRSLRHKFPSWFSGVRSGLEHELCGMFAAVGCVSVIARVAADRLDGLQHATVALAGLGGVTLIAVARRLFALRSSWTPIRHLTAWSTMAPLLLLPWAWLHILGVVANSQGQRTWPVVLGAVLLPSAYALALAICLRSPGRATPPRVRLAFAAGAAPFFSFPMLCPVANEIQFTLAQRHALDPRQLALGLLALLMLSASLLFWGVLRGRFRFRPGALVACFCFPAIVFGSTLLSVYQHHLGSSAEVDLLHDGEQITAVHQLLRFDKWPFVDIWPAHGLFDYLGALYAKANGFRPFELSAWNGVVAAFGATATYAIIANVSRPLFAFLVVTLLPIEAVLPLPQYSYFYADPGLLVVGLLSCWTLERPSTSRYATLSVAAFLCFFWSPTNGVASILSAFSVLALHFIITKERRSAGRGLGVFALGGACVLFTYVAALALCQRPVLETLRLVSAFVGAETLVGGLPAVIGQFDAWAFFQYIVLPGVGVVYLGKLALRAVERTPLSRAERILAFLTVASFVLFARALTRHGLIERFQPFFFPFLGMAVLIPRSYESRLDARRNPKNTARQSSDVDVGQDRSVVSGADTLGRAWFCAALAAYLVLCPTPSAKLLALKPFEFHVWQANEARFAGVPLAYPGLQAFFEANMRPDDTFVEMINAPLLYALLDREVPDYFFLPTMFYATDRAQDIYVQRLERFGGPERVPFAILPGLGRLGELDQIPSTLRSHRISEHVYRNYVPFGDVDGFDVWVSRPRWDAVGQGVTPRPLPFREPKAFRAKSLQPRLEGDALWLEPKGRDARIDNVVQLEGVTLGGLSAHHSLRFLYQTNVAGNLKVSFRYEDGKYTAADSARLRVADGQWRQGQLAIPSLPQPGVALNDLRIKPPNESKFAIKGLELVYGDPLPANSEDFALGMLPFVWGNFDAKLAASSGRVLQALSVTSAAEQDRQSFVLGLHGEPDKSAGNYLRLCVRLPPRAIDPNAKSRAWRTIKHAGGWQVEGAVTLSYGTTPASTFTFDLVRPDPRAPGWPAKLVASFEHECKAYVVRLSAQYAWSSQSVTALRLNSNVPIELQTAELLEGD